MGLLTQSGHETTLLDVSDLPQRATITMDYVEPKRPKAVLRRDCCELIDLSAARRVWWRRPQSADPSEVTDPEVHHFTLNEWHEATNGLWQVLDAKWMNPPALDEVAGRKALQLREAARAGLKVPRTLITSDPDNARAFVRAQGVGTTVFKTFSATHAVWRETRLVRADEFDALDAVRIAPVIFQEYIPAEADLRITHVGGKFFPAAIYAQDTDYPVDFRMSLGQARTEPCELPDQVTERLRTLIDRLGLVYGAIDMRRKPDGDYVFLEVNTAGEFLFVEERTGQPISQAIADWLAADD